MFITSVVFLREGAGCLIGVACRQLAEWFRGRMVVSGAAAPVSRVRFPPRSRKGAAAGRAPNQHTSRYFYKNFLMVISGRSHCPVPGRMPARLKGTGRSAAQRYAFAMSAHPRVSGASPHPPGRAGKKGVCRRGIPLTARIRRPARRRSGRPPPPGRRSRRRRCSPPPWW